MSEIQSNETDNKKLGLTTGKLLVLSIVSVNVYLFISLLIIRYWHGGGLTDLFVSGFSIWYQFGIGVGAGCVVSGLIYFIITFTPVSNVLSDYFIFDALSNAGFSFFDNTQLSFFAGAGEELLFRGAIQPLLGNALTSVIFVGIHGYFKFKSARHMVFGVMMFALSLILGLLSEHIGLIAAMSAHAVYDVIMLQLIQRKNSHN